MLESLGARHSAAVSQCWGVKVVLRWVGLDCCWLRKCIFFLLLLFQFLWNGFGQLVF